MSILDPNQSITDQLNAVAQSYQPPAQQQSYDLSSLLQMLGVGGQVGQSGATAQPSAPAQNIPYNAGSIQDYIAQQTAQAFGQDHVQPMLNIVNSESGFNPTAANPTSTARGLFQFLNTTAPSYGLPADASQASVPDQVTAGINYIKSRYGNPANAWDFHLKNGWY